MTTKVNKLRQLYNMRLNKAKRIVDKLEQHLPNRYVTEVRSRLKTQGLDVNSQYVRDVKRFQIKNPQVLGAILDFAIEHEKAAHALEHLIENN